MLKFLTELENCLYGLINYGLHQTQHKVLSFKTTIVHPAFSKSIQAALLRFKFCRLKRQLFIWRLPNQTQAALLRFKFCRLKRQFNIWCNPSATLFCQSDHVTLKIQTGCVTLHDQTGWSTLNNKNPNYVLKWIICYIFDGYSLNI